MRSRLGGGDDVPVISARRARFAATAPVAAFVAGAAVQVALDHGPAAMVAIKIVVLAVPVVLGTLVGVRVPANPVGSALAWVGAAPAVVFAVELWAGSCGTDAPWPASCLLLPASSGAWVWNLAGFVALCLVFPNGLLPGRRWRAVAWSCVGAAVVVNTVLATRLPEFDGPIGPVTIIVLIAAYGGLLGSLAAAVSSLVVRHRHGDEVVRQQLRWLVLGASTVPVLLAFGWFLQWRGASVTVAYTGFLVAMLLAVPAAVAIAVLRYDLFDVDRLLGSSLSWPLTALASAALFTGVVVAAVWFGADSRLGAGGAAFVTALVLSPVHRSLTAVVGRAVDRDRYVIEARLRQFVQDVRDGRTVPEQTETVLRTVLGDAQLRLLLRVPGQDVGYVDTAGAPADAPVGPGVLPLRSGPADVGALALGAVSTRRLRRAREAAITARLPIEVSRLRLGLREALRDVEASRERLVEAGARERRRLERDLHDGAQQQIVAVGMRLRRLQSRFPQSAPEYSELDTAVAALEETIGELRRLANGVRPRRLDEGLAVALSALVAGSPVPVQLKASDVDADDTVQSTVYYVVAEAYANTLKHARAHDLSITVTDEAEVVRVVVHDNGIGGAHAPLTAVRDRVSSIGGHLVVHSPPGEGTTVTVEIPNAHRRRR